jgi:hypothetical protein
MEYTAQRLPEDLEGRGWKQVRQESTLHRIRDTEWYAVVFMRPFDPGADDEQSSLVVRLNRRTYLRVSTNASRSASWDLAHHDAIGLMRAVDEQRALASET